MKTLELTDAVARYDDAFPGAEIDFITIRLDEYNGQPFIDAIDRAIERNAPLTSDEWQDVHTEVYGDLYRDGETVT